ncbi:MAG: hypothetical protein J7L59_00665 [Nanoarchaeota archaeon]|nr:hypothetical protein [Nanoarchaeota archaeon]
MWSYCLAGVLAGLLVASWNSFKDSPWEGFSWLKFIRSPIFGAISGLFLFLLIEVYGLPRVERFGFLILAIVALERVLGEAYKGFFRRKHHVEYEKGFEFYRLRFLKRNYPLRIIGGLVFVAFGWWLFISSSFWMFRAFSRLPMLVYAAFVGASEGY